MSRVNFISYDVTALLAGYYLKMNVQEGESKSFKLFKLVLMILIGLGIIGLFAMQSDEFKALGHLVLFLKCIYCDK